MKRILLSLLCLNFSYGLAAGQAPAVNRDYKPFMYDLYVKKNWPSLDLKLDGSYGNFLKKGESYFIKSEFVMPSSEKVISFWSNYNEDDVYAALNLILSKIFKLPKYVSFYNKVTVLLKHAENVFVNGMKILMTSPHFYDSNLDRYEPFVQILYKIRSVDLLMAKFIEEVKNQEIMCNNGRTSGKIIEVDEDRVDEFKRNMPKIDYIRLDELLGRFIEKLAEETMFKLL